MWINVDNTAKLFFNFSTINIIYLFHTENTRFHAKINLRQKSFKINYLWNKYFFEKLNYTTDDFNYYYQNKQVKLHFSKYILQTKFTNINNKKNSREKKNGIC